MIPLCSKKKKDFISKADEIFAGVEYFKEGLENQVEGCNVVRWHFEDYFKGNVFSHELHSTHSNI